MEISQEEAVRRYDMVRDELKSKSSEWARVVALCKAIPEKIDEGTVWSFGRDKPCYSNIKVKIGERVAQDIGLSQDFNDWRKIASNDWAISMIHSGRSWKSNDNFKITGSVARSFVAALDPGGLRSYLWRLYCIRELALALDRESMKTCIQTLVELIETHGGMPPEQVESWTSSFGFHAGRGWGHTTAYHMLTDLGFAVKPDIWLTTSAIRMGLLAPELLSNLEEDELAIIIRDSRVQHLAAKSVMELSKWIISTACPTNPRSAMREVDKVLMEWGRQGLAHSF